MPLRDVITAALSRPAGKVVDGPVRDIINEILAERGYASPAEVAALRDEADALRTQLGTLQGTVQDIQTQLATLQQELASLKDAPPSSTPPSSGTPGSSLEPTDPDSAVEEHALKTASAATQGLCKVAGCGRSSWRDGFCAAHAEQWRAGRLPGVVSPEGLVSVLGKPRRIAPTFAGALYVLERGQVRIGAEMVPSVAY
jgi:hypothetical protein